MRTIIAGSREGVTLVDVELAMETWPHTPSQVLCGMAPGADRLGEHWARAQGIPVGHFPADWLGGGPRAGKMRNQQMADNADALVAVWNGKSRGTRDMIERALRANLLVYIHRTI